MIPHRTIIVVLLALGATLMVGCVEPPTDPRPTDTTTSAYPLDTFDCPPLSQNANGDIPPQYSHYHKVITANGKSMLYLSTRTMHIRVVDLQSLAERRIDLQSILPKGVELIHVGNVMASPHDPNVAIVQCVTSTDTSGDGRADGSGVNYYRLTLDGRSIERITPGMYGSTGSFVGYYFYAWVNTTAGTPDSLLGAFGGLDDLPGIGRQRIYVPMDDSFLPAPMAGIAAQSRDGRTRLRFTGFGRSARAFLNDTELRLAGPAASITHASFSPNGRKLAFLIDPDGPDRYAEIWIIDVDRYLSEHPDVAEAQVINTQDRFCSYGNIAPAFITDATLAVSMFRDLDVGEYIWEITLDGRRVRQLTFAP